MASLYSVVSTDFILLLYAPINCFPHALSPPGATHEDLAKSVSNERRDHAKVAPNIDLLSGNESYMALPIYSCTSFASFHQFIVIFFKRIRKSNPHIIPCQEQG